MIMYSVYLEGLKPPLRWMICDGVREFSQLCKIVFSFSVFTPNFNTKIYKNWFLYHITSPIKGQQCTFVFSNKGEFLSLCLWERRLTPTTTRILFSWLCIRLELFNSTYNSEIGEKCLYRFCLLYIDAIDECNILWFISLKYGCTKRTSKMSLKLKFNRDKNSFSTIFILFEIERGIRPRRDFKANA